MTETLTGYGKWANNVSHRWQILPSATLRQTDSPTHTCFKQHLMACTNEQLHFFFFFFSHLLVTQIF